MKRITLIKSTGSGFTSFFWLMIMLLMVCTSWGQTSFKLVTSEAELEAGKTYLIVNKNVAGSAVAMSAQKPSNRGPANISITAEAGVMKISTLLAETNDDDELPFAITLGEGNQHWTLFDAVNNGFLYAASGSSDRNNYLRTRPSNSDLDSEWSITFGTGGNAVITSKGTAVKNLMRYNSQHNLFSCYSSGQLSIYLYKIIEEGPTTYTYENGAWSPSDPTGTVTADDNIAIIDGAVTLDGEVNVNNLTVLENATLNITDVLNVHGNLTMNGDVVFKSTATGTGQLGLVSPTSTIAGEATVERYMQNRRSYRMVSPAVTTTTSIHVNWQEDANSKTHNPNPGYGTHITGSTTDQFDGFDGTQTGNPSMWLVDLDNQVFAPITNTSVNTLSAGNPYLMFIRGDRSVDLDNPNPGSTATTLRAKGELFVGVQTQNFNTSADGDFAMFGNPYQSTVDVNDLFAGATNVNQNIYYIYDPSVGDYGNYVTVALPGGDNGIGSTANQFLQPGQAAQFATAAAGPSSLTFTPGTKAPGNNNSTNATGNGFAEANMINVQLFTSENFNNGGRPHDGFVMMFDDQYDNAITLMDAPKPMGFRENLGIELEGRYFSLERRELPVASEVFQIYSDGYTYSNYTLKLQVDGLEDTVLYLDDAYTGTSTLLTQGESAYSFEVADEASRATDRFTIRVEARLGVTDNTLAGIRLFPNPTIDGTFYIHAPQLKGQQVALSIADMAGRMVYNDTQVSLSDKITVDAADSLTAGIYVVTLKFADEIQTFKLIKK